MAWTAHLDDADRALMAAELRACCDTLEHSGDPLPLETCLREWRERAANPAFRVAARPARSLH